MSSSGLHISLIGNNEKWDIAFRELSFGSSEVNQSSFTWPKFFKSSAVSSLVLFLFLLLCSLHLSLSFLLHILFSSLFLSGSPSNLKSQEDGNMRPRLGSLLKMLLPVITGHFVGTRQ